MLEHLRQEVCEMNTQIAKLRLAMGTAGNVSGRDPESGLVVIKPSGVNYALLTPDKMVVVDLDGRLVEGDLEPSVDTETHLVVYRLRDDVGGITHTHSPYATSFAVLGQAILPYLTNVALEFGGPIPVGAYVHIGGREIGEEIVRSIGRSPAILMKKHGVFTIGETPSASLKTAAMLEEVAMTVHLAMLRGQPEQLSPDEVERCYHWYHERYGQGHGS
jgi:L-ribulose-5-phosphate 4-epimerase